MNPQVEITSKRPSNYSGWHRVNMPSWCYQTDGDWFEQRIKNGKLLAISYIETIQVPPLFLESGQKEYPLWLSKKALMENISDTMGIPCFVGRHKPSCDIFFVARFFHGEELEETVMNAQQYAEFLINL